jgi:hypothetical protein
LLLVMTVRSGHVSGVGVAGIDDSALLPSAAALRLSPLIFEAGARSQ